MRRCRIVPPQGTLFRVVDGAAFANHMHFDLSGIFQFVFDPFGNFPCGDDHLIVFDRFGLHQDADFAAGLDGVAFFLRPS